LSPIGGTRKCPPMVLIKDHSSGLEFSLPRMEFLRPRNWSFLAVGNSILLEFFLDHPVSVRSPRPTRAPLDFEIARGLQEAHQIVDGRLGFLADGLGECLERGPRFAAVLLVEVPGGQLIADHECARRILPRLDAGLDLVVEPCKRAPLELLAVL